MSSSYLQAEPGQPETIGHGRAPRAPHPHRVARLVALVVVVVLLAVVALVLDHRSRQHESARVGGCVEAATSSVRFASNRVDAIANYVRPALDASRDPSFRRRMHGIVSRAVRPTVPDVRRALGRCNAVRVLWLHRELTSTRQDCLGLLRSDLDYLDAVTTNGRRAFGGRSLPAGRCGSG